MSLCWELHVKDTKHQFFSKIESLQNQGKVPKGIIKFENLKSVKTDCIRGDPDDLIQL